MRTYEKLEITSHIRLNPYSIGRYSMSMGDFKHMISCDWRLNPYSIGRYSMRNPTWETAEDMILS